MNNFKRNIFQLEVDNTLPLFNFYYKGIFENGDTVHDPEINSWVDFIDENGDLQRIMIGGSENGCQLVEANSIVKNNQCNTCIP